MYCCCHPSQLNYKDLQTRPSLSHQYSSTAQHRTPGLIQDVPRVLQQLLSTMIALLPVLCTSLLFLHSPEGPKPSVAKGCMESRLHSASFCRQHGHRAPFRPHGQRTVCHPTGNTPSSEALFSVCCLCVNQVEVRMLLQLQLLCTLRETPGWSYLEERCLCLLLSSHSSR